MVERNQVETGGWGCILLDQGGREAAPASAGESLPAGPQGSEGGSSVPGPLLAGPEAGLQVLDQLRAPQAGSTHIVSMF